MKNILLEFKNFALKGNLIDIAVGFITGAAFTKVSNSFIQGIVMPPISLLTGKGIEGKIVLRKEKSAIFDDSGVKISDAVSEVVIKYGDFLSASLNFLVVILVMFLLVKTINKIRHEEKKEAVSTPPKSELLLEEIRDLLKNKN